MLALPSLLTKFEQRQWFETELAAAHPNFSCSAMLGCIGTASATLGVTVAAAWVSHAVHASVPIESGYLAAASAVPSLPLASLVCYAGMLLRQAPAGSPSDVAPRLLKACNMAAAAGQPDDGKLPSSGNLR